MLPNHAPLAIAEQFGTLAALHPGRIDLGLGRAPGSDQLTAAALRRSSRPRAPTTSPSSSASWPASWPATSRRTTRSRRIAAVPAADLQPPLWLLGSSLYSAELAGLLGLPFAFAHHFSGALTRCRRSPPTARRSARAAC